MDLPRDERSELILLGAFLAHPATLDTVGIPVSAFTREPHRILYQAILDMREAGEPIGPTEILTRLNGKLDAVGGVPIVGEAYTQACGPGRVDFFAAQVLKAAARREKIIAATGLLDSLHRGSDAAVAVAERGMQAALDEATVTAVKGRTERRTRLLDAFGASGQYITTPLLDINHATHGLRLGESTIVGGRSGDAKTALCLFFAVHAGLEGWPVLILSLEQNEHELQKRMIPQLAHLMSFRDESVCREVIEQETASKAAIDEFSGYLTDLPIWIEDATHESSKLEQLALTYIHRRGVKLVILDHAQKVRDTSVKGQAKERLTLSALSGWWYRMCKRHNVAGLLISQCNRGQEQGQKKRKPRPADLKGSGALEEDADTILLCYVEDKTATTGEILVSKHRSGSGEGTVVEYVRDRDFLAFLNINKEQSGSYV